MAFINKLSNIAKDATDKTSSMIGISKLNSKIKEHQNQITSLKAQLAEYYWTEFSAGRTLDEPAAMLCAGIKTELEAIEALNLEIQKIRNEPPASAQAASVSSPTACGACGTIIGADKRFCPECGAPAAQSVPKPVKPACSCGWIIEPGIKFCPECGTQVVQQ